MRKLHNYAWAGLIFSLLGYIPKWGHIFSLLGFIFGIFMYLELKRAKLVEKAARLYIIITLLSLLAALLATLGWIFGFPLAIFLTILAYIVGLIVAWFTFQLSREITATANITGSGLFDICAVMLKVSAFTMPILIGFLIEAIAQLLIYIAVINYTRLDSLDPEVEDL